MLTLFNGNNRNEASSKASCNWQVVFDARNLAGTEECHFVLTM